MFALPLVVGELRIVLCFLDLEPTFGVALGEATRVAERSDACSLVFFEGARE